jgi:L-ascorbate oxidase
MADFSDGSVQATQWPIPPNHFFDYEVETLPEDAGSYFYHSHVGIQALTASGPLIVEDCDKCVYDYDEERIVHIQDYFNKTDEQIQSGLRGVPFVWSGEVNAVLINGKGMTSTATFDGKDCSMPIINVTPGKTYRFRFIGATALSHVLLQIEKHDSLSIIAADAAYTQPYSVDRMQIGSGQRFDVLFKAKTKSEIEQDGSKGLYVIQFETRNRPSVFRGYAFLQYDESSLIPIAPSLPPLSITNETYNWAEYALQPLKPDDDFPSLSEVTRRIVLNNTQKVSNTTHQTIWVLNELTWTQETFATPLLVDIYLRGDVVVPNYAAALSNHGWDPATKSFPARVGEVLEIVFQNTGSLVGGNGGVDVHPFHAHGQHIYDVGSGNGTYDAEANEAKIKQLNWTPVKRDSTMLYRYTSVTKPGLAAGWRAWRVRVKQPGVWMVHCHTLQHMLMGEWQFFLATSIHVS